MELPFPKNGKEQVCGKREFRHEFWLDCLRCLLDIQVEMCSGQLG